MTAREAVNWLINLTADIGKAEHRDLWHYEQALSEIREMLEAQPERTENARKTHSVCLDTIDRQAAIDAVNEGCQEWRGIFARCEEKLQALPPVQPDIIRCKDCKHRILNENYGKKGYIKIKAMCELDTGDPFELGRDADDDDWYCADAERRTDED